MTPVSLTAQPREVSAKLTLLSCDEVGLVDVHVAPPSPVRRITPFEPTAQPCVVPIHQVPNRFCDVGMLVRRAHVRPASLERNTVPLLPTA